MTKIDRLIGQKGLHDFCFRRVYNLGQNKMEQQTPIPPPPNQGSLIWGGSGGTNFPSILSQIVVCCHEASLTAETKKAYSKWTQNRKYFRQAIFRDKNKFPYALINLIQISKTKGLCLHFYNFPEFFERFNTPKSIGLYLLSIRLYRVSNRFYIFKRSWLLDRELPYSLKTISVHVFLFEIFFCAALGRKKNN